MKGIMKRFYGFLLLIVLAILACSHGSNTAQEDEEMQRRIPAEAVHPLNNEEDLDVLIEKIGDSRIVLLGESSHGTSEFYTWRAALSKKLIIEKGFDIIAVEADWADAYHVNFYIKDDVGSDAQNVLNNFDRWPQWMWNNQETANLVEWLHFHNSRVVGSHKVGFYGLDVYGIWESLEIAYNYLLESNPGAAEQAKDVIDCFKKYNFDEQQYARATLNGQNCEALLTDLLSAVQAHIAGEPTKKESIDLLQNTLVAFNAEKYYRTAARNSATSWNIRDRHMSLTLNNLLDHYGPDSRIIVWEHNTHVGDARATDMAADGMVTIGQLEREKHGKWDVFIIGFGTNSGKVLAAQSWGSKVQTMTIPPGRRNSWEWILHQQNPADKIIFMEPLRDMPYYKKPIGHRAIGVVYNPAAEAGNYVPSVIPERYDAFIFIDRTNPLKALP